MNIEYRVYYNSDGSIITYTTESLDGDYIIVSREDWAQARHDARVIDGALIYTHTKKHIYVLARSELGAHRVYSGDMSVVLEDGDHELPATRYSLVARALKK